MPISPQQFAKQLADSGLLTIDEVKSTISSLPEAQRPKDGEGLARELIKQKKLTSYQAQEVYANRGKALVLGNYVVLEKLGEGAMGLVLKAEHRRIKRQVAIKVLSPSFAKTEDALKRFLRELRATAALDHPNIVRSMDADESDGTHFFVMEFVDGSNLSLHVKKHGPLSLEEGLQAVIQAARGLEYAHGLDIVHRDIKPGNLVRAKDGTLKILDMGLARFASGEQEDLTGTGQIMGTVDYMSPEQALSSKTADARSDIYSLGVTLWYLLTGRPMYPAKSMIDKLMAHRQQPIPKLAELCPAANAELQRIFEKMCAKKAADRYQSMTDVIADLERCRDGGSAPESEAAVMTTAAPTAKVSSAAKVKKNSSAGKEKKPGGKASKKLSKQAWLAIAGGVVTLLAVIGTVCFLLFR